MLTKRLLKDRDCPIMSKHEQIHLHEEHFKITPTPMGSFMEQNDPVVYRRMEIFQMNFFFFLKVKLESGVSSLWDDNQI